MYRQTGLIIAMIWTRIYIIILIIKNYLYIAYKVDFYRIEQQYQKIKASLYGKYSIAILAV